MVEIIEIEGSDDAWLCPCGNTPDSDGFVSVEDRREVEPTDAAWPSGDYCCLRCGRIANGTTRQVVRRVDLGEFVRLDPPDPSPAS